MATSSPFKQILHYEECYLHQQYSLQVHISKLHPICEISLAVENGLPYNSFASIVRGQVTEFRVIDRYYDHVTLLYYGATLEVLCECSKLCETDQPMKLLFNEETVASTNDHKPNTTVAFKLKIDDKLKLGSYSFTFNFLDFYVLFIFCLSDVHYPECNGKARNPTTCNKLSACSKGKACYKSMSEEESCATMKSDFCARISGRRVCTVDRTQVDSLCHSMFGDSIGLAEVSRDNTCEFYRLGVYAYFSELLTSEFKPIPMGSYAYSVGILKPRCSGAMENKQTDIEVRFILPQREKVFNAKARCGLDLDAKSIIEKNFKLPAATIKILLNYTDAKDKKKAKGFESYFFFVLMKVVNERLCIKALRRSIEKNKNFGSGNGPVVVMKPSKR
uniref:Uncharacterized protein n=1 Tax=Romanomermis culicivorax TaxID=13658 RepID=A0A915JML1_ROMCU